MHIFGFLKELYEIYNIDVKTDNILKLDDFSKIKLFWKLADLGGLNLLNPSKLTMSTLKITHIYQQNSSNKSKPSLALIKTFSKFIFKNFIFLTKKNKKQI